VRKNIIFFNEKDILFDISQTIDKGLWYTFYTIRPEIKELLNRSNNKKRSMLVNPNTHNLQYSQAEGTQLQNLLVQVPKRITR